jgi:hypothetical protein
MLVHSHPLMWAERRVRDLALIFINLSASPAGQRIYSDKLVCSRGIDDLFGEFPFVSGTSKLKPLQDLILESGLLPRESCHL